MIKKDIIKSIYVYFTNILIIDDLLLFIGLLWASILLNKSDILSIIISLIVLYIIIFFTYVRLASFVLSLLYLIITPILFFFQKTQLLVRLLHIGFFAIWTLTIYYLASISLNLGSYKPTQLILCTAIVAPFEYYCRTNSANLSSTEITYVYLLKVSSFISCIFLLLFNINIYWFGTIFIIIFLLGLPLIEDAHKEDYFDFLLNFRNTHKDNNS